jgi:hypothetical protein
MVTSNNAKITKQADNLLEKAAQQILGESLGFDEGRAYYLILLKKDKDIEKEFSYSKKYRLLKNLFDSGAIGKIKPHDKDFFSYIPLPPSFLDAKKVPNSIVLFLEGLYIENHKSLLQSTKFSQIILKDLRGFVLFLLKHIMNNEANILGTEITPEHLKSYLEDKEKINSITINSSGFENRHLGIIDNAIGFEFLRIRGRKSYDYIGYITSKKPKENNSYLEGIEKEFS